MRTFHDIEIRRPELARSYLQLLGAQPGRPIALFAPRRVGKTFFLDRDLTPEAKEAGWRPVYADLWLQRTSPLLAVNHALEEALDDIRVPRTRVGKLAKTAVKKIGALGASVDLGDMPARRALPGEPALRLDALIARAVQEGKRPILLMLDEIQTLARAADNDTIAALRAVLQKRKRDVAAVFTGSSQEDLAALMSAAGGPMYQFAQLIDFPVLGEEYVDALAEHFERVHRNKRLSRARLNETFGKLGFKPALLKDLVIMLSAEGDTDIDAALARFIRDERHTAGWRGLLASQPPLERALLVVIARGGAPLAKETIARLAKEPLGSPTIAKVRVALERLRKAGIVAKPSGSYAIEDPLFAAFLAQDSATHLQTR